jgi:hypothetical protein
MSNNGKQTPHNGVKPSTTAVAETVEVVSTPNTGDAITPVVQTEEKVKKMRVKAIVDHKCKMGGVLVELTKDRIYVFTEDVSVVLAQSGKVIPLGAA